MLPYLAMFCISLMILAIIQSWSLKGIGFKFWLLVVVLLPCLLAGLRGVIYWDGCAKLLRAPIRDRSQKWRLFDVLQY